MMAMMISNLRTLKMHFIYTGEATIFILKLTQSKTKTAICAPIYVLYWAILLLCFVQCQWFGHNFP